MNRHVRALLAEGRIVSRGKGRATRYLAASSDLHQTYLVEGLAEDAVWDQVRRRFPELERPEAVKARTILAHGFTEMLNNAIDHSGSPSVDVAFQISGGDVRFRITDRGIGAYENVREHRGLSHVLLALQEVSKGKLSTMPDRHSGEGIFFTSKMADLFALRANGLRWTVDNRRNDESVSDVPAVPGTEVTFELALSTGADLSEIFARYSHDGDDFDTSRVVVKLFERGVEFVSRSEAKRLLNGLERFRAVVFDFKGVELVGQGFADEIFRVWAHAHPQVLLSAEDMRPAVERMVRRALPAPAAALGEPAPVWASPEKTAAPAGGQRAGTPPRDERRRQLLAEADRIEAEARAKAAALRREAAALRPDDARSGHPPRGDR